MNSKQREIHRQLIGSASTRQNPPLENAATCLQDLLTEALRAQDGVPVYPQGHTEPTGYIKRSPAVMRSLNLTNTAVLIDQSGGVVVGANYNMAAETVTIGEAILSRSRVIDAGAKFMMLDHLQPQPTGRTGVVATTEMPMDFSVIEPAKFQVLSDDVDQGVAGLQLGTYGAQNVIVVQAKTSGLAGNSISLTLVKPAGNNTPLSVTVSGNDISVNLATGSTGLITTTAAQLRTAIAASGAASALITASLGQGTLGSGLMTALAKTNLTGGAGLEPPVSYLPIKHGNQTSMGVSYRVSRKTLSMRGAEHVAAEVMQSIVLGAGEAVDRALLGKLTNLQSFSMGKTAASGVKFEELRGLVGSNGVGGFFGSDNRLKVLPPSVSGPLEASYQSGGVPAEFCNATDQSIVGHFARSLIVLGQDLTVHVKRLEKNGGLTVTAWLSIDALVPSTSRFWAVA